MVEIKFKNGSYIKAIPNNDSYRSKRYEEQWEYWKQNPDKFVEKNFVDWNCYRTKSFYLNY